MKPLYILAAVVPCSLALGAFIGLVLTPEPMARPAKVITRVECPHPNEDTFGPIAPTPPRPADLQYKIEERDARWDKCIEKGNIPVPGYPRGPRWGLVCLRPEAIVHVDGVAW